ncbi:curli assembly protein CsgF [Parvularcula marina]|uniref:curli assembly protein CsgF n=2 Tax=Parvularcula marina TaxID=2292771 RepID=UPI003515E847
MRICAITAAMLLTTSAANAQDLVYEPINPSFGGNSFNSAHLLAIANAQNSYDPPSNETSDLDRFIRSLESRLMSSLASEVTQAIFGEGGDDQGTIVFGDQTIEYSRGLDGIQLTVIEGDGSRTVITVPTLMTSGGIN